MQIVTLRSKSWKAKKKEKCLVQNTKKDTFAKSHQLLSHPHICHPTLFIPCKDYLRCNNSSMCSILLLIMVKCENVSQFTFVYHFSVQCSSVLMLNPSAFSHRYNATAIFILYVICIPPPHNG